MPYPKRIKPVEYLSEQAGHRSSQRKILRLKSFDARIEKRDLSPSRSNSPAWSLPDAGAAKVTRKKSLLLLPNEPGNPVAKEVASRKHAHASAFLKNLG